ncbi:hypothetical protein AA16373_0923 [Komagataeibacter swingsii DSM 16373]|nr:hypothetical protein AA16373_0923 [Komagataeibacter swingsii DSM 16373]
MRRFGGKEGPAIQFCSACLETPMTAAASDIGQGQKVEDLSQTLTSDWRKCANED